MTLQDKLATLPTAAGVYLFKDAQGNVIYVGKARVLRDRVRQYFQAGRASDPLRDALAAIERVLASEVLNLVGLHAHIGSQIFELEPYTLAIRAIGELAGDWCRLVNVGGGLGVAAICSGGGQGDAIVIEVPGS